MSSANSASDETRGSKGERLIFISYRRDDAAGYAGAIYDRLMPQFSQHRIFMDVDAIEPFLPFDEAYRESDWSM